MSVQVFKVKAPIYMTKLMEDFPALDVWGAAAIMGNLAHESGGLTNLQEDKPTVPGSRGGFGWAQWTGPRRRRFEKYCADNGYDTRSDTANYGMLWNELKGTPGFGDESRAIGKVAAANGLSNKVKAFEQSFERAGVKHYASRDKWAVIAYDAYKAAVQPPEFEPIPEPLPPSRSLGDFGKEDLIKELLKRPNVDNVWVSYVKE